MKWILRRHWKSFLYLQVFFFATSILQAQETGKHVATGKLVDTSALLKIERRVMPKCLVEGPNRFEDLPAYYQAENLELSQQFAEAQRIYETESIRPYQSLTLVAGAAGVGKTFIKNQVFKKSYAAGDVCKFDLKELYKQWQASGLVEEKPDLCCGKAVLNRLLSVKEKQKQQQALIDYLKAKSASFYVIDSLDEVHPDDYQWILAQIEQFVFQEKHPFVQVVVFGRGLAFRDYWQTKNGNTRGRGIKLFVLNPPKLTTTGDLLVSNWNYDGFRFKLRWSPDGNDAVKMPLEEYRRWVAKGYPATDIYRTVTHETNESMNPEARGVLSDWSQKHSVVGPMLYNLAGNGILRDIVENHVTRNQPFDERKVMQAYLIAWMNRDSKSDDRPSEANPQHLDLYLHLLQEVAIKYLVEDKLDDQGYFEVLPHDVIEVVQHGEQLAFPVARILNRSGLKLIDPRELGIPKYRFEPIWFHRLLVEMRNEQLLKQVSQ